MRPRKGFYRYELEECAYENARLYKEITKKWHDLHTLPKEFHTGQQILLYNTRHRLFPGKLQSQWTDPYNVIQVFPYGTMEIQCGMNGQKFKVNGLPPSIENLLYRPFSSSAFHHRAQV